jgi:hypothetical protein
MRLSTGALVALLIAMLAIPTAGQATPRHQHHCDHHCTLVRKYEPYHGCVGGDGYRHYCGRLPIPPCVINAESHGLVHEHSHPWSPSGWGQMEKATWDALGGGRFAAYPYQASALQQAEVLNPYWDHGRGAYHWTTAAGCGF